MEIKTDLGTMVGLADNAFDCSTEFTYRVAQKFNKLHLITFVWLVALTMFVFFK